MIPDAHPDDIEHWPCLKRCNAHCHFSQAFTRRADDCHQAGCECQIEKMCPGGTAEPPNGSGDLPAASGVVTSPMTCDPSALEDDDADGAGGPVVGTCDRRAAESATCLDDVEDDLPGQSTTSCRQKAHVRSLSNQQEMQCLWKQ